MYRKYFVGVRCKNDCSLNGICLQQTCNCNKGWERADCSSFHCKDVGNCGPYGTCVGPNHCKCRLGWTVRFLNMYIRILTYYINIYAY